MPSFAPSRSRDAYAAIRGYRYQFDTTILRWLELDEASFLELECGEDIDRINTAYANDAGQAPRLLEQVKHRQTAVSLRTQACIEALVNALEHKANNPTLRITFRFCTNARVTVERASPFSPVRPAIDVWNDVRLKKIMPAQGVAGLRTVLASAHRPPASRDDNWQRFRDLVSATNEAPLVSLIESFEWSVAAPASEELRPAIVRQFLAQGHALNDGEAQQLYERMFVALVRKLSSPGLKRLSREELLRCVRDRTVAASDVALLNRLQSDVLLLEQRVTEIARTVHRHEEALSSVLQSEHRLSATRILDLGPLSLEVPPSVSNIAGRTTATQSFLGQLATTSWLVIHGGIGSGKSELAKLIARARNDGQVCFLSLRDRTSSEAEVQFWRALRSIAQAPTDADTSTLARLAASRISLLVVDDLPQLIPGDSLSQAILAFVRACRAEGRALLSTSHFPPPAIVAEQLPAKVITVAAVPPFSESDSRELLAAWGAPSNWLTPATVGAITAAAGGHPVFIAAVARFASSQNWTPPLAELVAVASGMHAASGTDDVLARLLVTVGDPTDRAFLYRMCLIFGAFRVQEALAVAQAGAPIDRPRERLTQLTGLWIQPHQRDRLLTCPLVRPLAQTELASDDRAAVHGALAEEIIQQSSKTVFDVVAAYRHLLLAGQHERAGIFLILGFHASHALPPEQLRVLLDGSYPSTSLPTEMSVGTRLYLRGLQIQASDDLALPHAHLFLEAGVLTRQTAASDHWAIVGYTVHTLPIRAQADFAAAIEDLKRAVATWSSAITATSRPDDGLPQGPASLLWLLIPGVRNATDLQLWLDTLVSFSADELQAAFSDEDSAFEGCTIASARAWMSEFEKSPQDRNWPAIDRVLSRAEQIGKTLGLEPLRASATAARIVVVGDYLNRLGDAAVLAEAAIDDASMKRSVLVIAESLGRQYLFRKDYSNAIVWLTRATQAPAQDAIKTQVEAYTYLGIALANAALISEAITSLEHAVSLTKSTSDAVSPLRRVAVLAELGLARWKGVGAASAFGDFDAAAQDLLACEDRTEDWAAMALMFGHAVGYLAAEAAGTLLTLTNGEAYLPPYPMMFMTSFSKERAAFFKADRLALLGPLFVSYAEAVGNDERAAWWAEQGISDARKRGNPLAVSMLAWTLVSTLVNKDDFVGALEVGREAAAAQVIAASIHDSEDAALTSGVDVLSAIASAPPDDRSKAARNAASWGMMPIAFRLGTLALADSASAAVHAQAVADACKRLATDTACAPIWQTAGDMLSAAFATDAAVQPLNERSNLAARTGHTAAYVIGYLGMSLARDCTLQDAFVVHCQILPHVEHAISAKSSLYRQAVPAFITAFWTKALSTQRFRFRMPALFSQVLESAPALPVEDRCRSVLRAAMSGLGCSLPEAAVDAKAWLTR